MENQNQISNLRSVATRQDAEFKQLLAEGKSTLAMFKFNERVATMHAIYRLED